MKKTSSKSNPFFDLVVDNCECDGWWKFSSPPKVPPSKTSQQDLKINACKPTKKRNAGDSMRIGCLMGSFEDKKISKLDKTKLSSLGHHQPPQDGSRLKKIKEVRNIAKQNDKVVVFGSDNEEPGEDIFLDAIDFPDQEEVFYDFEKQNDMKCLEIKVVDGSPSKQFIRRINLEPVVSTHQPLTTPSTLLHNKPIQKKTEKLKPTQTKHKIQTSETNKTKTNLIQPKNNEAIKPVEPTNTETEKPTKPTNTQTEKPTNTKTEKLTKLTSTEPIIFENTIGIEETSKLDLETTHDSIPVPVFSSTFIDIPPKIETFHIIPLPADIKMDETITQKEAETPRTSVPITTVTLPSLTILQTPTTTTTTLSTTATIVTTLVTTTAPTNHTTTTVPLTTTSTTTIPVTTTITTNPFSAATATTTTKTGWPSAIFCDYEKPKFLKIFEPSEPWYLFGDEVVQVAVPSLPSEEASEASDDLYDNSSSLFNVVKNTKHKTSHHFDHFSYMKKASRVEEENRGLKVVSGVLKENNSKKDIKVRFKNTEKSDKIDDTLKENLQEFRKSINNYKEDGNESAVKKEKMEKKKEKDTKERIEKSWKKQDKDSGKYGDINGGIFTDESEEWYTHVHNELDLNKCIYLGVSLFNIPLVLQEHIILAFFPAF